MDAEPLEQRLDVRGESNADAHVGEGVFEDQIPADDPGHQFAERGVGVGVGRAGDGNHRGQFGVAEAGEDADDGNKDERECERRTGAGSSGHGGVGEQVVDERGVADFGGVELLARHGGADDGEDAGADNSADAERGERPGSERFFQSVFGLFRLADQLVDGFAGKQLAWQGSSPRPFQACRVGKQGGPVSSWETLCGSVHDGDWTDGQGCGGAVWNEEFENRGPDRHMCRSESTQSLYARD